MTTYVPPLRGYQSPPLELYEGHYPDASCNCKGCIRDRGVEEWLDTFRRENHAYALGHPPGKGCDGKNCSAAHAANGGRLPDDLGHLDEEIDRRIRALRGEVEEPEARALVAAGPYRSMPLAPPARAPLKGWALFKHKLRRAWWWFLLFEQGDFRKRWPYKCVECKERSKRWIMGWTPAGPHTADMDIVYLCPHCQSANGPDYYGHGKNHK